MIEATVYNRDDAEVCRVWLRVAPRVGDTMWIAQGKQKASEAVRVAEVGHQVDNKWRPKLADASGPPHMLILHVARIA